MSESDGRRIKRSLLIKADSIKFMGDNEIRSLKEIELLRSFINKREKEINDFNKTNSSNKNQLKQNHNKKMHSHYFRGYQLWLFQ